MKRKIADALVGVSRLYLDSSPVIYFVERHPDYFDLTRFVFQSIRAGAVTAVTGPVTLAECLVAPTRQQDHGLSIQYFNGITRGCNTEFLPILFEAVEAARIRARYNLRLPDSFQVAMAIASNCDAILTNDVDFKRVAANIPILVLSELEI